MDAIDAVDASDRAIDTLPGADATDAADLADVASDQTDDQINDQVPDRDGSEVELMPVCDRLSAAFSAVDNPNPPWSFGWTDGQTFRPYSDITVIDGVPLWFSDQLFEFGIIGKNLQNFTLHWYGTVVLEPDQVFMHPGTSISATSSYMPVIRWNAASPGSYALTVRFDGVAGDQDTPITTTDVHVLVNQREVFFDEINLDGKGNSTRFSASLPLAASDALDFAVGEGSDYAGAYDSTGISVEICLLP